MSTTTTMHSIISRDRQSAGLATNLPPISDVEDIFDDMTKRALLLGLQQALDHLSTGVLRVATACSGTECPLLAMTMISEALQNLEATPLHIEHLFSAEIVPFKQAYIERNFKPAVIFRDITEMTSAVRQQEPVATTVYGARVPIPRNIDLFIAGTSCVDFSRLNNQQRELELSDFEASSQSDAEQPSKSDVETASQTGASSQTFSAVRHYVKRFRPRIVLIENVKATKKHWAKMLASYERIGYASAGVFADSKDFYLPQTRERGYMLCLDTKWSGARPAVEQWQDVMSRLKRRASSPVTDFLLSPEDTQERSEAINETTREVPWDKCRIRHVQHRTEHRLGTARPFTQWKESGRVVVPEGGSAAWFRKQSERVKDSIDCSVLRKAVKHGYDARFKTRIWNLSQNIDRELDTGPFGISQCITPTGIFFLSDANRVLSAQETLKLQGLPLSKISLTTETPAELQILAGNAMSSTVVGAAILSALICAFSALDVTSTSVPKNSRPDNIRLRPVDAQVAWLDAPLCHGQALDLVDMGELAKMAHATRRLCICEIGMQMTTAHVHQCLACRHTACERCAGSPLHEYGRQSTSRASEITPAAFARCLRNALPLQLRLESESAIVTSDSLTRQQKTYLDLMHSALQESFRLDRTQRTDCWTTTYLAPKARLELIFDNTIATWYLSANPSSELASNNDLRQMLDRPVGRCAVSTDRWEVREPSRRAIPVQINGSGDQMPSWWARCQLPDYKNHTVWQYLDVSIQPSHTIDPLYSICGRYEHAPRCGTACESLYIKVSAGCPPIYLFKDPTRLGDPAADCFVFAHSKEPINYGMARPLIARLPPTWTPWYFAADSATCQVHVEADVWIPVDLKLSVSGADVQVQLPDTFEHSGLCAAPQGLAKCILGAELAETRPTRQNKCPRWITELMKRHLPDPGWQQIHADHNSQSCSTCAPTGPLTVWHPTAQGTIDLGEDPISAASYEQSIRRRPSALFLEQNAGTVTLQANVQTLAHRATAALPAPAVNVRWRLREHRQEEAFTFKPFRLETCVSGPIAPAQPGLKCTLFPLQRLMLAWMIKQESGAMMLLESSQEASLPEHDWTLEVRAQARLNVRGGICADHPGFGKTITSLALIATSITSAAQQAETRQDARPAGLFAMRATLVVCPRSLVQQWSDEIRDKLSFVEDDLIVVSRVTHLQRVSIEDVQKAKIILVSRAVLASEDYIRLLATFSGTPLPSNYEGYTLRKWIAHAKDSMIEGVQHIKQSKLGASQTRSKINLEQLEELGLPLPHMFRFERIIVDESHDLTFAEHASITALTAVKRWCLSATPNLTDTFTVSQMAALIGVPLHYGSVSTRTIRAKNFRVLQSSMSGFERFNSMREPLSEAADALTYAMDKLFLSTFVRQNILDFVELPVQQHMVHIHLPLNHLVLYHELWSRLYQQEMRLRPVKTMRSGSDVRLAAAMEGVEYAEEALSRLAARTLGPDDSLNYMLKSSQADLDRATLKLVDAIQVAQQKAGNISDRAELHTVLEELELTEMRSYVNEMVTSLGNRGTKRPFAATVVLGTQTTGTSKDAVELDECFTRFVATSRWKQYLQSTAQWPTLTCYCSVRQDVLEHSKILAVSGLCGHVICESCHQRHQEKHLEQCMAPGCQADMFDGILLWDSALQSSVEGQAKIAATINLLTTIREKHEQAMVFVQYTSQIEDLELALKQAKLKHTAVRSAKDAGNQVSVFKQQRDTTAIILNASDETAAGLNLQNANHVIFMSPLLRTTQYTYGATMAQAIGRVKRHGQQREIHVHRLYAVNTIDEDILEHREPELMLEHRKRLGVMSTRASGFRSYSKAYRDDE